ncbi:Cobalamin-5-phosphate synthase, CobS [Planococcus antarcticus DSM 14505]|uniref:Adenosylcobinamide-GDP ribazoletransferase n=1 Tax=Planococcus antarcticus DSM 14505 TaxID=1185653 RepID=A0A1C7DEQ5_9BACL|nr:adenosylcobinamide-GDP ribazoletransferase [Planococcus antarcticus]ANU10019.1 cobalamin 5'-phosphate synthase [Planococcus antarcticus DSM 14505]EIM07398.1 Cobalamin-5-phosphate synthase, CobS [Planococcus antarcticus DSM 14505]
MSRQVRTGILLALQFFSVIPVKKQLPMEKVHITTMYTMLPLVGILFGSILAVSVWLLRDATDVSSLLIGFAVVAIGMALTGGLHMDGLADTSDAYFSYQDREKRLDIMGDPRIGAFGTMVLLLAIIGKIILVAESIDSVSLVVVLFIPVFSRIGLLALFSSTKSAKPDGLAAFFQRRTNHKIVWLLTIAWMIISFAVIVWSTTSWTALILLVLLFGSLWLYRIWCLKNFGGVTGDLFGAYVEGVEILVWTSLLFFV